MDRSTSTRTALVLCKRQPRHSSQALTDLDPSPCRLSKAELAAIALAQSLRSESGIRLVVATVGDERSDATLAEAADFDFDEVIRIHSPITTSTTMKAAMLADLVHSIGASIVFTGDYSTDGGSGLTPLRLAQALDWPAFTSVSELRSVREQDQRISLVLKRRCFSSIHELARLDSHGVISVEPNGLTPRRASLQKAIATQNAGGAIRVISPSTLPIDTPTAISRHIQRNFAPSVAPLTGDSEYEKLVSLLRFNASTNSQKVHNLTPRQAAERIVETLTEWGVLDGDLQA